MNQKYWLKKYSLRWIGLLFFICFTYSHATSQTKTKNLFIFGHSLLDHRPPINPVDPDETTVPHWMYLLAEEAGHTYTAGGQYGFLPQHQNTPPIAQWGYAYVPGVWDSDNVPFEDADISSIFITAGNFVQWQPPSAEYPGDPGITPISATETIIDFVGEKDIYIYENWPDMAPYLNNGWPATEAEYDNYNTYLRGDFHNWWLTYYNALVNSRPDANVKMIPVGPIIADLTDGVLSQIPVDSLYEDDAPHGRPTIYFLASLISYMAIFEEQAPATFQVPVSVHSEVREHFTEVISFIWNELNNFTNGSGESMVFASGQTSNPSNHIRVSNSTLFVEEDSGMILKGRNGLCYNLFIDESGELQYVEVNCPN